MKGTDRRRRPVRRVEGKWWPGGGLLEPSNLATELWLAAVIGAVGGVGWLVWKAVSWAFG